MNRILVLSVLALSVAACDGSHTGNEAPVVGAPKQEQSSAASANDAIGTEPDSTVVAGPGASVTLPQGISFGFPYTLRVERAGTSPKGEPRRWIGLEYTVGDQQSSLDAIQVAMASAGFSAEEQSLGANDGLRQAFLKKDYGRVLVTVLGGEGQKLSNPDAKGVIWLDFPSRQESM